MVAADRAAPLPTAAIEADDLLCSGPGLQCSERRPAEAETGFSSRLVYLRLETATALETKVAGGVVLLTSLVSFLLILALVICKTVFADKLHIFQTDAFELVNLVLASLCLLILLFRSSVFTHRVLLSIRRGQHWKPRRRRVAILTAVGAGVQLVNIICWLLPNATIVAAYPDCTWFSELVNICGSIRWVAWNSTLLLYLIHGTNLQAWNPDAGLLRRLLPHKQPAQQPEFLLVLDAPWWHHLNKAPLWLVWTAGVCAPLIVGYSGAADLHLGIPDTHGLSLDQCRLWNWEPVCINTGWTSMTPVIIVALSGVYFLWYLLTMARVHMQLAQKPFAAFRAANILYQLQLRSMLLTYKVLVVCISVLWFLKDTCMSYVTTWLGMIPMQLVATALAWHNLYLFMPKDPASDPVLQVWLQEVAWTEADMPKRLVQRNARAEGSVEALHLQQEPMFCYETALKLLKWSSLAYTDLGQAPAETSAKRRRSCGGGSSGQCKVKLCRQRLQASCKWLAPSASASDGSVATSPTTDSVPSVTGRPSLEDDSALDSGDDSPSAFPRSSLSIPDSDATDSGLFLSIPLSPDDSCELPEIVIAKHDQQKPRARRKKESTRELFATAMAMYSLTDVQPFYDPILQTKALLAWNRRQVVLAFRGTASIANAWSDLQVWRTAHHRAANGALGKQAALVHTGFYRAWVANGLHLQVIEHLQELYKTGAIDADAHVCVTGHSMGGALAVLAAHDIAAELKPHSIQCYTFGCPYVGNHAFARQCERCVKDTWHVIHDRDIVTRSGKFGFLFKRPGHRVYVDVRGEMLVRPSALELQVRRGAKMQHHWLRTYRSALVAVLLAQFSSRGSTGQMSQALQLGECACLRDDLAQDGVDWHKLRRTSRWGSVASRKVPAPKACHVRRFIGRTCQAHAQPVSRSQLHADNSPGISLASLQRFRSHVLEEEQAASVNASSCDSGLTPEDAFFEVK